MGTFYRLFKDKEALFKLLHEKFVLEANELVDKVLGPDRWVNEESAAKVLRTLIEALGSLYADKEGMLRALIIRSPSDGGYRK